MKQAAENCVAVVADSLFSCAHFFDWHSEHSELDISCIYIAEVRDLTGGREWKTKEMLLPFLWHRKEYFQLIMSHISFLSVRRTHKNQASASQSTERNLIKDIT